MTRRTDILEGYAKFRSILNQTQVDMERINALSDALEKVNGKLAIHEASGTFITFPISDRTRSVLVHELQNDLDYYERQLYTRIGEVEQIAKVYREKLK